MGRFDFTRPAGSTCERVRFTSIEHDELRAWSEEQRDTAWYSRLVFGELFASACASARADLANEIGGAP